MSLHPSKYGTKLPTEAPQDEFWAHWRDCSECWGYDFAFLGHGGCEIGKELAKKMRDERARQEPVQGIERYTFDKLKWCFRDVKAGEPLTQQQRAWLDKLFSEGTKNV